MRTTDGLPDDLLGAARTRAAEQSKTTLPLIGVSADPTAKVTNADLEAALADVDAEKYA